MENETAQQAQNRQPHTLERRKAAHLAPWQFKKGQSGNPSGRKVGKSLKEYAKEMLGSMDAEERQEFLHGLPKETIWKLAEGNPANNVDLTSSGKELKAITIVKNYGINDRPSTETD